VGRAVALLIGLVGGVALAGIVMAVMIPLVPAAARSQGLVWAASAALVALCMGAAFLMSRPRRE
jgi:hypothetical protein